MKQPQTLRARIIVYFCLYLGIILLLYSAAISGLMSVAQDFAFEKQLSEITDKIIKTNKDSGTFPELPLHFKLYKSISEVPEQYRKFIEKDDLGIIELNNKPSSVHISIFKISPSDRINYLFYDVDAYEFSEEFEFNFSLVLFGIGFIMMLIGGFFSLIISRRIMTPVRSLVNTVKSFSPDKSFTPLTEYNASDEVGLLVDTINDLIKRTDNFVQREREFTLFASHELRNPVSVIKGATEVLRLGLGPDNPNLEVLERIEFSVKELNTLIYTFLTLSRGEVDGSDVSTNELKIVVENVVETFRFLIDEKPVEVFINTENAGKITAPDPMISVAVGNLVRNSFQYTMDGKVEITVGKDFISIIDTGLGLYKSKPKSGTGIGLLIVRRLCERMGWHTAIVQNPSGGTKANLYFK
ncbi:MAG: HAMP domain-containing histidine kinase [Desulfobacterales bacterium]|nr:HAMP domain-containing histidine kinase [Desulfobacterales bacterium]